MYKIKDVFKAVLFGGSLSDSDIGIDSFFCQTVNYCEYLLIFIVVY